MDHLFDKIITTESYTTPEPFKICHFDNIITYRNNTLFFCNIIHRGPFKYKISNSNLVIYSDTFFYLFVNDNPYDFFGEVTELASSTDSQDYLPNSKNFAYFCDLQNNYLIYSVNRSIYVLNTENMFSYILPIGVKNYTVDEINGMSLDFLGMSLPYLILKDNNNCYVYNIKTDTKVSCKFKYDKNISIIYDCNSFHIQYSSNDKQFLKTFANSNITQKIDYQLLFYKNIFKIFIKSNIIYLLNEDTGEQKILDDYLFDLEINNNYFLCGTNLVITEDFELLELDFRYKYVCKFLTNICFLTDNSIIGLDANLQNKFKIMNCCENCVKIHYIQD